ncbi:MAG: tripartite tricarboxylate transporter substrate binding protein [Betaproteobacteria bacterium]|nr:tripartite tricarboxylate transporter substrate binding protein [Betaproteobacteria bacterium]
MKRILALAVALLSLGLAHAQAPAFPDRPVRLVVPFPPGGSADFLGRTLAEKLSGLWGKPVVVENRPGGSTLIGLGAVAKSEADGYTIGMNTSGLLTQPAIRKNMPFDVLEDFAFITRISEAPFLLTVPAGLQVRTVPALIAWGKANPGKLNYSSFGVGSTPHILGEVLVLGTGVPMVHVPFKGTADMLTAHLAGQVQVNFRRAAADPAARAQGQPAAAADHRLEALARTARGAHRGRGRLPGPQHAHHLRPAGAAQGPARGAAPPQPVGRPGAADPRDGAGPGQAGHERGRRHPGAVPRLRRSHHPARAQRGQVGGYPADGLNRGQSSLSPRSFTSLAHLA